MEDVKKEEEKEERTTEKELSEIEEKVMHPEINAKSVVFLDKTIKVRPLPISFAKQVNAILRKISIKMAELAGMDQKIAANNERKARAQEQFAKLVDVKRAELEPEEFDKWYVETSKEHLDELDRWTEEAAGISESFFEQLKEVNIDEELATAIIDCTMVLVNFYKLGYTAEQLNADASLPELEDLIRAQLEVQKDDDFLLLPLRNIMGMLEAATQVKLEDYRNLLGSLPSV